MRTYVANFAIVIKPELPFKKGCLAAVVEAANATAALDQFRELLQTHRGSIGGTKVFMESCAEIISIPKAGVITNLQLHKPGADGSSVNVDCLGASADEVVSHGFGSDESEEKEPFVTIVD
jgi:hypothetical protein